MPAYEYEVVRNIPEIGARVWDVLVWRYPEIWLCRKRDGEIEHWKYPAHYTFLFLKYEDHLRPLSVEAPSMMSLARQAVGDWRPPLPEPSVVRLRLVE